MSAFVVSDLTINRVVSYLHYLACSNVLGHTMLENIGFDLKSEVDCKALAEAMFSLNVHAVDQRYGDGQAQEFRALDFHYNPIVPPSAIQALKSLSCWHYQCTEGDTTEHLLYRSMDEIQNILALHIVYSLKEYDQAEWG